MDDSEYRCLNCDEYPHLDFDEDGDVTDDKTLNMNSSLQHRNMLRQLFQNDLVRKRDIGLYNTEEEGKQGPIERKLNDE